MIIPLGCFFDKLIFFYNNPKKQEGCHCKKFDFGPIRKMFEVSFSETIKLTIGMHGHVISLLLCDNVSLHVSDNQNLIFNSSKAHLFV